MVQPTLSKDFVAAFAKSEQKFSSPRRKKVFVGVGIVFAVLLFIGLIGAFLVTRVLAMKGDALAVRTAASEAYDAIKSQNLPEAANKLTVLSDRTHVLYQKTQAFSWMRVIPIVGNYYGDLQHGFTAGFAGIEAAQRAVAEIEPYADVLGFKGQGTFNGGSAQDRIAKILETLSKITPALDDISGKLSIVDKELSAINERRYPEKIGTTVIRSRITQAKELVHGASTALVQNRSAVELLPDVAGATTRKKYLIIFQNSGELRPTGGFMTAYATINIDKGKVEPENSGDIYDIDAKFTNKPPIPPILKRFLTTETKWNLRDMNVSPDYKVSMDTFNSYYQKIQGPKTNLDGIIAVDTHFLESLIKIIGPVDVPGYGTFSAQNDPRCDCAQILYALSEIVDRPTPFLRTNRKGILGPLMSSVLSKTYSVPKNLWPAMFQTVWGDVQGKHIQFYFFDPKLQAAAEGIDVAGRVLPTQQGSDYYFQVDANLGGAKSNFFVQSQVQHEIALPTNGVLTHTVTVSYKNPFKASVCNLEAGQLCLNSVLQDWIRFYLPQGAKLTNSQGFDEGSVTSSDDLGHSVVEGTFRLQPLSQAKLVLTYTIPYTNQKEYTVQLQKQGGTDDIKNIFTVNNLDHEVILNKDQTVTFGW